MTPRAGSKTTTSLSLPSEPRSWRDNHHAAACSGPAGDDNESYN
jgi:hypothetical protein